MKSIILILLTAIFLSACATTDSGRSKDCAQQSVADGKCEKSSQSHDHSDHNGMKERP